MVINTYLLTITFNANELNASLKHILRLNRPSDLLFVLQFGCLIHEDIFSFSKLNKDIFKKLTKSTVRI